MGVLIVLVLAVVLVGVPSYVIGQRCGVADAWVAFIPFVGPTMVLLWSINRSGWMVLLGLIPLVNIAFGLWLVFALPSTHGRSLAWGLGLLIPLIGVYAYAFTLAPTEPHEAGWAA
jgi:hypothetical protein